MDDDFENGLIWWSTHRATFGLVVRDGIVAESAPYARRWAQGRDAREIYRRGKRQKGVTLAWVPATETEHLSGSGTYADRPLSPDEIT
ncbi:hypothetical protein [Streptosporangium sp. NPDC048865]|uniref:hypothetical protein n=1 Tax=Streptosporangium sp. NPDC048865 TaxID=3155766 RepID=UPI00344AA681